MSAAGVLLGVGAGIGDTFQQVVFNGSMLLAIPLAMIAGLVSFASPCVLPLVPGYLGYVTGMAAAPHRSVARAARAGALPADATPGAVPAGAAPTGAVSADVAAPAGRPSTLRDVDRGRMVLGVSLFVAGFTVVFVVFGVLAGSLGGVLAQWSDTISRGLGVVVVVMGLAFLGWLPFAQRERRLHLAPTAGVWGAPLLGIVFGLGWAPCIGPTLVAVYTLALDEGSAARGAVLSIAYCIGLGLPFVLIAFGFDRSAGALRVLRERRVLIMRIGGAVLVLVGLALVSGLWGAWTQSLQGLIGGFEPVV